MSKKDNWAAFETGVREMVEKMRGSAMVMHIHRPEADTKLIVETGAAVLLNKPLIVLGIIGQPLPPKLALIADEVVYYDGTEQGLQAASADMQGALARVLDKLPKGLQ